MKISHIHVNVSDLSGAINWMSQFAEKTPAFENECMAVYPLGDVSVIFDKSDSNSEVTVAFESQDCDLDFKKIRDLGATPISEPQKMPYGVKVGYFKGPGQVTIELEQVIK